VVHAFDGALLLDRFLDRFGEAIHILLTRRMLFEIENGRENLPDILSLQGRYRTGKQQNQVRAVRLAILVS